MDVVELVHTTFYNERVGSIDRQDVAVEMICTVSLNVTMMKFETGAEEKTKLIKLFLNL